MIASHRPLLGRQRNLAGAGRGHPADRLPEGARHGAGRAVPAGGADADRPDRCAAWPSTSASRRATSTSRCGTAPSSPARAWPPWRRAGCSAATSPGCNAGWQYHAVRRRHRARAARGLRAAGRRLADHEDRGRAAGATRCKWAKIAWLPVVVGIGLISIATPWVSATVRERWFSMPAVHRAAADPADVAGRAAGVLRVSLNCEARAGPASAGCRSC